MEAYEFLSAPENFPKWASGPGSALRRAGDEWIAETPDGPAVANGKDCDLVLTLFRQLEMSDAKFAADAEWVMRDLHAAKRILETPSSADGWSG